MFDSLATRSCIITRLKTGKVNHILQSHALAVELEYLQIGKIGKYVLAEYLNKMH